MGSICETCVSEGDALERISPRTENLMRITTEKRLGSIDSENTLFSDYPERGATTPHMKLGDLTSQNYSRN